MNEIKQLVKYYVQGDDIAILQSKNGNAYKCNVSDKVRMTMNMKAGDTAIIRIIDKIWIIVDVEPKITESSYMDEIPVEDLGYDY